MTRDADVMTLVQQPVPPVYQPLTVDGQPAPPVGELVTIVYQLALLAAKSRRLFIVSPQWSVNTPRWLVVPRRLQRDKRRGLIVS